MRGELVFARKFLALYDDVLHNLDMQNQETKTKISKSYRLQVEIVRAIQEAMASHGYQNETQFLEDLVSRALGLDVPKPKRPRVSRKSLSLAA